MSFNEEHSMSGEYHISRAGHYGEKRVDAGRSKAVLRRCSVMILVARREPVLAFLENNGKV
jgi:hypothetical protein